jgi:hypothetical protein
MMAKSVQLPKFNVATKTYNSYNRKVVQQEKVNYDPVTITFHDDSADVILNVWQDYFKYHYRDSDYASAQYNYDSKYNQRQIQNWGYTPRTGNPNNASYFNTIQIYSLHKRRFSSYTLVRPIIQSFQHGQHVAGAWETMEHSMTVAYEAVLYASGPVASGEVLGFDMMHYDNQPSPIASLHGAGVILEDLINGDLGFDVENALTGLGAGPGLNSGVVGAPGVSLSSIGSSILRGQNSQSTIFAPTSSTVQQGLSVPPSPTPDAGTGIDTMNSQGSQVPDSGQGVPGSAAITETAPIGPDYTPISTAGNQVPGDAAVSESSPAPNFSGGYYGDQVDAGGGGYQGGDESASYGIGG